MKFLMKSLGWDKWRAEFERALAEVQAEGGVPLPFDPDTAAGRAGAGWPPRRRRRSRTSPAASRAATTHGPGIHPEPTPGRQASRWRVRAVGRHEPAAAEAGRLRGGHRHGAARRPDERTVPRARRPLAGLQRRDGARDADAEPRVPLGASARMRRRSMRGWRRPGSGSPTRTRSPTSRAARAPSRASSR